MTQPRKLDDADAVARLLRLDGDLGLTTNRLGQVLVEAQPATGDGRIPTDKGLGERVVGLMGCIEHGARGQQAVEPRRLDAEPRVCGLEAVEDLLFLDAGAVLENVRKNRKAG